MDHTFFERLKARAAVLAADAGTPSFYAHHGNEMGLSCRRYADSEWTRRCRLILRDAPLHPAHGIPHCEKVALEAGAVLLAEAEREGVRFPDLEGLMLCAQIAGLLHDIKRAEDNHTVSGSIEAGRILGDFDLDDRHKRYIVAAIRNHEAFKEVMPSEDEEAKLVSDALYDADKFRWGPDNFTTTLWLIVQSSRIPIDTLYCKFPERMKGIHRIKDTFRTDTGRRYGPEFIDLGIRIGDELYREIEEMIGGTWTCS